MLNLAALALRALFCFLVGASQANADNGIIKGAVYDLNGATILNIPIRIENMSTKETKILKVDSATGIYMTSVSSGRYKASLIPVVGYPMGEDHASFFVSPGEKVTINFRPTPLSVASFIEKGNYVSRYDGELLSATTHFVPSQNSLEIKDIKVWFYGVVMLGKTTFKYENAVATFEKFTLRGETILYDSLSGKLVVEGKVLFEDGRQTRILKRVTIDIAKAAVTTLE